MVHANGPRRGGPPLASGPPAGRWSRCPARVRPRVRQGGVRRRASGRAGVCTGGCSGSASGGAPGSVSGSAPRAVSAGASGGAPGGAPIWVMGHAAGCGAGGTSGDLRGRDGGAMEERCVGASDASGGALRTCRRGGDGGAGGRCGDTMRVVTRCAVNWRLYRRAAGGGSTRMPICRQRRAGPAGGVRDAPPRASVERHAMWLHVTRCAQRAISHGYGERLPHMVALPGYMMLRHATPHHLRPSAQTPSGRDFAPSPPISRLPRLTKMGFISTR